MPADKRKKRKVIRHKEKEPISNTNTHNHARCSVCVVSGIKNDKKRVCSNLKNTMFDKLPAKLRNKILHTLIENGKLEKCSKSATTNICTLHIKYALSQCLEQPLTMGFKYLLELGLCKFAGWNPDDCESFLTTWEGFENRY